MAINYVRITNILLMSLKYGIAAKTELFKRGKQDCQRLITFSIFCLTTRLKHHISFKISLVIVAS